MNSKTIYRIVASLTLLVSAGRSNAQTCPTVNCTNSFSGSMVTVANGTTYCLNSGSWSGGLSLNEGGTIYVGSGATLNVNYIDGSFKGTIINCGTLNLSLWSAATPHTVNIVNYGTFTSGGVQNYSGTLTNYGVFNAQQFYANNAIVNNYKKLKINNVSVENTSITNFDTLDVNGKFYLLNGGLLDNKVSGFASLNGSYGNTELAGTVENSGSMFIREPNSGNGISRKLNNYGYMKVLGQVTIGSSAYFTNDSLLEFENPGAINLAGNALLQNNKVLNIISGSLALNSSTSQMVNNGTLKVSGSINQNAAGSKIINSCKMISGSYFIGNGTAENKGIIWVTNDFKVEGMASEFVNDITGFVRGNNFRNSGKITGYGSFYFTGNTDFQSAGIIAGSSATQPILFFDVSQTGNQIFDTYVQNNPATNTIRPTTMTPIDTNGYYCGPNSTVVGFPPNTDVVNKTLCANGPIQVNMDNYVAPHSPVSSKVFVVQSNSVRLFDQSNANNPTNNTTHLVINNKGVFDYNTSTGLLTFTPASNFVSGEVKAQYLISNQAQGDLIAYPSPKTAILITIGAPQAAPTITVGN